MIIVFLLWAMSLNFCYFIFNIVRQLLVEMGSRKN